jgi:hypothetical protein
VKSCPVGLMALVRTAPGALLAAEGAGRRGSDSRFVLSFPARSGLTAISTYFGRGMRGAAVLRNSDRIAGSR